MNWWKTSADDGDVCFEGGPDGCFLVCLCEVVAADHLCELVKSSGAGRDDEDADAEDEHYSCFLAPWEIEFRECGHGEDQDHDV